MACRVRIQPTALRELEGTVEYLLGFGPNTASAFLDEWENVIECLKDGSVEPVSYTHLTLPTNSRV